MRSIAELRAYRDKRLAQQEAEEQAAAERVNNAHFDHVRQFMSGIPATHGIPFQKMATQICRRHGFDPLGF